MYSLASNASVFLDFDWLDTWLSVFEKEVSQLLIICLYSDGSLVSALPLYQNSRHFPSYHVVGTGEPENSEVCSEYQDALVIAGYETQCLDTYRQFFKNNKVSITLPNVRQNAFLLKLCDTVYQKDLLQKDAALWRFSFSLKDKDLDNSTLRRKTKRYYNKFCSLADAEFQLAVTEQDVTAFRDMLITTHRLRWGKAGAPVIFDDPHFLRFHTALMPKLVKKSRLILAAVTIADKPIATWYGMVSGTSVVFYQSGIDESFKPNISPGKLVHYLVARWAQKMGVEEYDFLASSTKDNYKEGLSDAIEAVYRVQGFATPLQRFCFKARYFYNKVTLKAKLLC